MSGPSVQTPPSIDANDLEAQVGDLVLVFEIRDPGLTWQLSEMLPPDTQIYGDAARVYPVGDSWQHTPRQSPLRLIRPWNSARDQTERLVADAMSMAHAAGLLDPTPASSLVHTSGRIVGFPVPGQSAIVQLENGGFASLHRELIASEVPIEWALHTTQKLSGLHDRDTGRFLVQPQTPDTSQLRTIYPDGSVTLALTISVTDAHAVVALHPKVRYDVPSKAITANPLDRLELLLTEGEVVAVRVQHEAAGASIALSMVDVDDDEKVLPSMPLLPGGEPWLMEGRDLTIKHETPNDHATTVAIPPPRLAPIEPPPAPAAVASTKPHPGLLARTAHPATPSASASVAQSDPNAAPRGAQGKKAVRSLQDSLASARAEIQKLERELEDLRSSDRARTVPEPPTSTSQGAPRSNEHSLNLLARENKELLVELATAEHALHRANADLAQIRPKLRNANKASQRAAPLRSKSIDFTTDEEWVRHETYLCWLERYSATERARLPLGAYLVGPEFGPSVRHLPAALQSKVWRCVVDVATDRWRDDTTRHAHPLRSGLGAHAPDVVRQDGGRCIRLHVESKSSAARRMHLWRLPDGRVELSRVVTHEDMTP